MRKIGTDAHPVRVAIIGAGPAGFYAADQLLSQNDFIVAVDLFDKLPTPFGLVRGGVAPDHQKIKNVTRVYEKTARNPRFRFFGNVEIGRHIHLSDLRAHYHQIVFATGAQTDRELGIPGENLAGSHSATEFVAWYNGHPEFRHLTFDLSRERVAIVGVGNVAVDVARILCRTIEELEQTDIADYALDALRRSRVREVYMLGRRGPAQAAFTNPEVKELGDLPGADAMVPPEEAELDPLSKAALDADPDRETLRKLEIIRQFAERRPTGKPKKLVIRFFVSPVELLSDDQGRVRAVRLVHNELYRTEDGRLRPRPTDRYELLPADLVFRSIGYRGVPLPDVPFDRKSGVIPNEQGRVLDPESGLPVPGLYAAGWIKRGATGVIGTNKADAQETVSCMVDDLEAERHLAPPHPGLESIVQLLEARQPDFVTFEDWKRLDRIESERGKALGRPRVKFTTVEEMLEAIRKARKEAPPVVEGDGAPAHQQADEPKTRVVSPAKLPPEFKVPTGKQDVQRGVPPSASP